MCTPFDETSVDHIANMGFDLLKIASCSARDWPLIEARPSQSTSDFFYCGSGIHDIDNLVIFGEHRALDFALMHCVSIYPTPPEACRLRNIAKLRKRYPKVCIGWSTHEDPDAIAPMQMATAYGAVIFERHIGVATETFKIMHIALVPPR